MTDEQIERSEVLAAPCRVIILHGAHGRPDSNWFPWLHDELEAEGFDVVRPILPTPDGQSLATWLAAFDRAVGPLGAAPTVLVGHSLGAAFALRLVERAKAPILGLYLAAPFIGSLGLPDYDSINSSFFTEPFDWNAVRELRGRVCRCWAGDDDPYVPLHRSKEVAERLGVALDVVRGGGHLNDETGFNTFSELRDAILSQEGLNCAYRC